MQKIIYIHGIRYKSFQKLLILISLDSKLFTLHPFLEIFGANLLVETGPTIQYIQYIKQSTGNHEHWEHFLTLTHTLLFQKANRMHNCLKVHYSPAPARVTYSILILQYLPILYIVPPFGFFGSASLALFAKG